MQSHRFSLSCILAAALLAVFVAAPAFAAEKPADVKGAWAVNMVQGEKKNEFAYCLARAPYTNDLQLAIALSAKREVNVGVMVPDAGYAAGDKYPMTVSIDGKFKRERPGIAAQPQLLMVPLGPDKEAIPALKSGKVLSLEGPEDIAYFSLKGTGKALDDLQRCVDVGTGKIKPEQMAAAAAATAPSGKAAKGGKAPKFPPSLMQLLKSAGLKDISIVEIPDPSKAPVDFAWRTEGVLGGLRERPVPADFTLDKMSGIIEEGYKKQCSGEFKSNLGTIEELPGVTLRKADFSCEMKGQGAEVSLLIYITDTHLFSMFMHEAHGNDKAKAAKSRDAITAQIRKLAKEQKPSAAPAAAAPTGPIPPGATPATTAPASALMRAAPESSSDWSKDAASAPAPASAAAPAAAPAPASTAPQQLPSTPPASQTPPPAVKSDAAPPPPVTTDKK